MNEDRIRFANLRTMVRNLTFWLNLEKISLPDLKLYCSGIWTGKDYQAQQLHNIMGVCLLNQFWRTYEIALIWINLLGFSKHEEVLMAYLFSSY